MATTSRARTRLSPLGSPLGAHLRDDSRVTNPDPSPSTTTSTSDKVVLTQAIALVPSEAIALSWRRSRATGRPECSTAARPWR